MKDLALALALTLLAQSTISLTASTLAVLAPVAQADVGVAASSIGIFSALIYATAALSALFGGTLIARHGAVRVSQYCLLLTGSGLALCALAHPVALVAGALVIGCGYGPITPAGSEILVVRTPERVRNLVMSIRQSGVPVGGAIAGVAVPMLLLAFGWKAAVLAIAALSVLCAFGLEAVRGRYDSITRDTALTPRPSLASLLRMVFAHAELRHGALASFVYAGIQVCMASYLVVFLTERALLTLINAGFAFSAAMVSGVIGRVLWGIVADYIGSARIVLGTLGVVMALSSFTISQVTPGWPLPAIIALCVVFGASAIGWNGVYVAEIIRIAPAGNVALMTGASLAFTYFGVVIMPVLFWVIVAVSASYTIAFNAAGAVTLLAGLSYFLRNAPRRAAAG